jgi:hypothetical protein
MADYEVVRDVLTSEEVSDLRGRIAAHAADFLASAGKHGLGPRYRVLDGERILALLPEIAALAEARLTPLVAALAAGPVVPLADLRRRLRLQHYRQQSDGFRWHFDRSRFVALVALINSDGGRTEMIGARLSRLARPFLYALYPLPQVFSALPRRAVTLAPGSALLMRGNRLLHRGVSGGGGGERLLIAASYDVPGSRPSPWRERIARRLNF